MTIGSLLVFPSGRSFAMPISPMIPISRIQAVEWNFERLDIPSRKVGRPIKGGLSTLQVAISRRARPAPEPLPRLR